MPMLSSELYEEGVENIVIERFGSSATTINAGATQTGITISGISKTGYTPLIAIYAGSSVTRKMFALQIARPITNVIISDSSFY